jgi:hypothetical protein
MPILGIFASGIKIVLPSVGYSSFNNDFTSFSKFNMVTETNSTVTISVTNEASAHASNSGVSGYRYGNTTNGVGCQKFAYSNEAVSTLANSLPQFRYYACGQSNSGTAAYITGGATSGFATRYKTVVKSPFSNDTFSTLGTSFTQMGNGNTAFSNNHIAGYTIGGEDSTTGGPVNAVNKINYSNDAISSGVATVPLAMRSGGGFSNDGTAGYTNNGTGATTAIYKLLYSNDTVSTLGATIVSPDLLWMGLTYRYQTAGYWEGGYTNSSYTSIIQKLLYSNETRTTIAATIAVAERSFNTGELSNNGVI